MNVADPGLRCGELCARDGFRNDGPQLGYGPAMTDEAMSDAQRRDRGVAKYREVYGEYRDPGLY